MRTLTFLFLLLPAIANADVGTWTPVEVRAPILKQDGKKPGLLWQTETEWWITGSTGINLIELRTGPLLDVNKWFMVALRGAGILERDSKGVFQQEARVELEPTFKYRLWNFTFSYRNRFEWRWRGDTQWPTDGYKFRDRNQLRINYEPDGGKWLVGISDELFIDLAGQWLTESRAQVLAGWKFMPSSKLEIGYMLRNKFPTTSPTTYDHYVILSALFQW